MTDFLGTETDFCQEEGHRAVHVAQRLCLVCFGWISYKRNSDLVLPELLCRARGTDFCQRKSREVVLLKKIFLFRVVLVYSSRRAEITVMTGDYAASDRECNLGQGQGY